MNNRLFSMPFSKIYQLYIKKVSKKGRTEKELRTLITWLTGYSDQQLNRLINDETTLNDFFDYAPQMNPDADKITGMICGYRVEEISDPMMQKIRWMDKIVDDLSKGKDLKKILNR